MIAELLLLLGILTFGLLSPGPDFLVVLKNSFGGRWRRGLGTVAGITLGLAVQMTAITLGFSAAVRAQPRLLTAVAWAGSAYLVYLGMRALLARPAPAAGAPAADDDRPVPGLVEGLLCNLTNAKAFLFFVSLFAQLVGEGALHRHPWVLPVTIVVHGAVLWSLVVAVLQFPPLARALQRGQAWLLKGFGALLILLGILTFAGA